MNRGQYYARTGVRAHRYRGEESYKNLDEKTYGERYDPLRSHRTKLRNRGWINPNVREAHRRLGKGGLFKVSDATVSVEQLGRRMDIVFQGTLAWGLSRNAARHRFHRDNLKHSAMDAMVHELAPRENDIVVFGDFFGRRAINGEAMAAPVKATRRKLAKKRRVLKIDEFRTSRVCHKCHEVTPENVAHPKEERERSHHTWMKYLVMSVKKKDERKDVGKIHPDDRADLCSPQAGYGLRRDRKVRCWMERDQDWMETSLTFGEALQKRKHTKKINGVYNCELCRMRWSRDVNAAANMLRCFFSMATTGKRAQGLIRQKNKRTKSKGANEEAASKQARTH